MRLPQQRLSQAKKVQLLEARASPASSTHLTASWIFLSYEECSFSVSFAKSDLTVACFLVHYIFVTVQQPTVEDKAPHMCAVLHRRPRPSAVPFGSSSKPQVTGISPICQMIRLKFKIERMLAFENISWKGSRLAHDIVHQDGIMYSANKCFLNTYHVLGIRPAPGNR